jgi:hypothetical protein
MIFEERHSADEAVEGGVNKDHIDEYKAMLEKKLTLKSKHPNNA